MSEDEHSADDGVREVKSPGHKQKPDAGEEAVLVRKRAKVLSLSSHPELLVGPLSSDSHLAEPALPKLLRTLSNAFVIKGDSSDLPRLLERYAQWAEDMQVREGWPGPFVHALDKVPKKDIKRHIQQARQAQVERFGKTPEEEVAAPVASPSVAAAASRDDAPAPQPAEAAPQPAQTLNEALLEKIRLNKQRALELLKAKQAAATAAAPAAAPAATPGPRATWNETKDLDAFGKPATGSPLLAATPATQLVLDELDNP